MILKTNPYRMKCLVVDDESIAVKGIANYIGKLDFLEVAASCSSASEAAEILRNKEIDLMFLDINMPRLSGLDFLESLDKPPLTIITTAYSEYALDGFRLHVTDYLMKPIAFQRFFQAVSGDVSPAKRTQRNNGSGHVYQAGRFLQADCMGRHSLRGGYAELRKTAFRGQGFDHSPNHDVFRRNVAPRSLFQNTPLLSCQHIPYRYHFGRADFHGRERTSRLKAAKRRAVAVCCV